MKKRIKKKKIIKEQLTFYRGVRIHKNSPYAYDMDGDKVCLYYCPINDCELYFTRVSHAKRYIDSIPNFESVLRAYENQPWPEAE